MLIFSVKGGIDIAIYHLSVKIFSRGKGASAVAKAAYRAAECITSEYDGKTSDYTRKGGVIHKEILLPGNAPKEYLDRAVLWNAVEKSERYKTAQLAREIEIALPKELSAEQNLQLVREYVQNNFVEVGMCADLCIHDKGDGNPHAHVMLTLRSLDESGKWLPKSHTVDGIKMPTNDWSNRANCEIWRENWSNAVNAFLEQNNIAERVDNRSYERQGVEQIPTVHLGVAAHQMERRGIQTERGNINRKAEITNKELKQLKARIRKCKDWIYSQPIENAPRMVEVISRIADGKNLNTQWAKIADLKTQAKVLLFLQNNSITDVHQLANKVTEINEKYYDVSKEIKAADRRIEALSKHLFHYDNYKNNKAVYDEFVGLKPKKQEAFYAKHAEKIGDYLTAKTYLDGVMNGRTKIPVHRWKSELETLTIERISLAERLYSLKDDVRNVEVLRKGVEGVMREEQQRDGVVRIKGGER